MLPLIMEIKNRNNFDKNYAEQNLISLSWFPLIPEMMSRALFCKNSIWVNENVL